MNVCLICQQMSLLQFQIVMLNMRFIHIKLAQNLGFMTNKTETLQELQELEDLNVQALTNVLLAFNYAEENNLTNTQEFINFLDKLNELSVKY